MPDPSGKEPSSVLDGSDLCQSTVSGKIPLRYTAIRLVTLSAAGQTAVAHKPAALREDL